MAPAPRLGSSVFDKALPPVLLGWFCIVFALLWGPVTVTPHMCLSFHSRNEFAADGGSMHLPASWQLDSSEVAVSEAIFY